MIETAISYPFQVGDVAANGRFRSRFKHSDGVFRLFTNIPEIQDSGGERAKFGSIFSIFQRALRLPQPRHVTIHFFQLQEE